MSEWIAAVILGVARYRLWIAIGIPVLGSALAVASSLMTPRGRAKGLITGGYLLLAAVGAAFLLFAVAGLIVGAPTRVVVVMFVPGIALAVIMGIFSPQVIREYQRFEFRKLAAEIFRRS